MNPRSPIQALLTAMLTFCVLLAAPDTACARMQVLTGMRVIKPPVVNSITPGAVHQGQAVDLLLRGSNLRDGLGVELGPGIQAGKTLGSDARGGSTHVHVTVAANAATGRRQLVLLVGNTREPQRAFLSVEAGLALQALPSMHALTASSKPEVTSVAPARLVAGRDYLLRITGKGLPAGTRFDFGAGVHALANASAVNDTTLALKVHVDPSAQSGHRVVGFQLPAVQNAMAAVAGARGRGPASIEIVAAQQAPVKTLAMVAPVTLDSVQPARVRAGSQAQLVFSGQGLKPGLVIDYGPGFHMQPLRPLGNRFVALVRIDPTATPGRRVPRASQAGTTVQVKPAAGLLVIPAPVRRAPLAPPPNTIALSPRSPLLRVDSLYPARLDGGRSYTVQAGGTGFGPRMQLDLGRGVTVERVDVENAQRARLTLQVDADAPAGMRFARARLDPRQVWSPQPARVLIQPGVTLTRLPQPKWKAPDWPHVTVQGRIDLERPKWYAGLASKPPPVDPVTHQPIGQGSIIKTDVEVPTLKDDVIFSWSERNPGLAQWYEVRFYQGKKLITTRKIEPEPASGSGQMALPTVLQPDPALIEALAKARGSGGASVRRNRNGGYSVSGQVQAHTSVGGAMPSSDITWEVVGLRRYGADGVQPQVARAEQRPVMLAAVGGAGLGQAMRQARRAQPPVVKAVEHSERWPLNVPLHPTGMVCGDQAASLLDVKPIDNTAGSGVGHTGERWELTGSLNLGKSPWSSNPQRTQWPFAPGTGNGKPYSTWTKWNFDNVFIDWGDGTVVPLALVMQGDKGKYSGADKLDLGATVGNKGRYLHAYAQVGTYTVRVYQLPEDDLQDHDAAGVSLSVNHDGSLYGAAVSYGSGGAAASGSQQAKGFGHGQAVADRAYMVMCKAVHIAPRHDDATDGPLHLIAAKLRGFPENPGTDAPPAGVKVAPAPDNSPFHLAQGAGNNASRRSASALFGGRHGTPTFSACDVSLTGGGYLYYYGTGKVRVSWYLDDSKVGSSTLVLAPSWPRPDKQLAGKNHGDPLIRASDLLMSSPIPLKPLGNHRLRFDAEVIPDARGLTGLAGLMGQALGSGNRAPDAQLASQLAAGMQGAPAVGVLPPAGVPLGPGGSHVAWLRAPLQQLAASRADPILLAYAAGQARVSTGTSTVQPGATTLNGLLHSAINASGQTPHKPPQWAGSNALAYRIVGAKTGEPCVFRFPVHDGGTFQIGGLQDAANGTSNVSHKGNLWSGKGQLVLNLPTGEGGGTVQLKVPITFHDWELKSDGVTVAKGDFDLPDPFASHPHMAGLEAVTLTRLTGHAGGDVKLSLTASLGNPNILAADTEKPPPPLQAQAVISPQGDFYADAVKLPDLAVYNSGFFLRNLHAALDFSATRGSACAGGDGWEGVALGSAEMDAFTFQLKKGQSATTNDWGIDGAGFCGKQSFASYDSTKEKGSIHWDGIDASAGNGTFTALYKGLRVHVPWLDVDLTSSSATLLQAGAGSKGDKNYELALTGDAPRRDFGAVSMQADGLVLGTLKGVGMAVAANSTHFGFRADGQQFLADVAVPGLYFGMDGKAYFEEQGGSTHVDLSGTKGRLSQGVIDLKSVDVTATPETTQRLQFNFAGSLKISDALPAADAPVSYRIDQESKDSYVGSGPYTGSFVIHKPFPDAHASTNSVIRPKYVGSQTGSVADDERAPSLLDFVVPPARAAEQHMRYCGDVDLGVFKGPPVKGGFALGYIGSDDFWAAHADMSMGKKGMPLVPPFMTLYTIGGGLGYNVAMDSFSSGLTCDVTAMVDHTPAFDAHLVIGDPTHFSYGLDGHFTVKVKGPEAGARMKYKAWMLKHKWEGGGDFWGRFQYMGGSFDGNLNGQYSFLDGKVYIEAKHDAISMHFGHGTWYIHAGTRDNPVKGHVLIINAAAWVGVGNTGMYAGAKAHLDQGAGKCSSVCARVTADALVLSKITTQPHISADADMHVHAKGCAFDVCLNAGVGASTHIAALPPELSFTFHLGGCPPGHLDVGLRILPSPKPDIGGGVCLW